MMKKLIKKSKGVSLISLVITVAVILILTNVVVYNAADTLKTTKLSNMQADIENLRDKVSTYYAQYGMIPADTSIAYTNTSHINSISEATDTGPFYVIDLVAMENITLNYGKDYEKIRSGQATTQDQINQLTDLYIINETSHNIFYVDGIEAGDETFYTDYSAEDKDKVAVKLYGNKEYTDKNGDTATIPGGFEVSDKEDEQTIDNGLVIRDESGNEFVWVPVPDVIYDGTTEIDQTYTPMVELQSGTKDYQGMLYRFSGSTSTYQSGYKPGTTSYREPSLVTGSGNDLYARLSSVTGTNYDASSSCFGTILNYGSAVEFGAAMQDDFNDMVESVKQYHGFYVGRYELGLEGTTPVSKNASTNDNVTTADGGSSSLSNWWELYKKCKEYTSEDSVVSSMMWGSQYDAMLNWMAKLGETVGTLNSNKRNSTEVTGSDPDDFIRNVYDLYGCHREWTLEAYQSINRVNRGGGSGSIASPAGRNLNYPNDTSNNDSARLSLYIKVDETEEPTTPDEPEEPEVPGIVAADIPATDYGAIVKGYDCTNSAAVNNWLLFYADDNNIYLIADNYISYNYIPTNSSGNKPTGNFYSAGVIFEPGSKILMNYSGSASITDSRIKALNNEYFNIKGYSSGDSAMKAIAYMLDINAWSVYAGEYADYAIGTPTLELFLKSYNEKHGTNYEAQAVTSYYGPGYTIGNGGNTSTGYGANLSKIDSLYTITSTVKASGMWLASPGDSSTIMVASNGVYVGPADAFYSEQPKYGFRPIVCLKHDVKLQKNSDGSYTIIGS